MPELSIFEQNYREVAEKHVILTRHMRSPLNNDGHVVNWGNSGREKGFMQQS